MAEFEWLTAHPIAHRGYHNSLQGRVENTLSSVRAAVERRFAIEIDLQLTADEKVIAFHDETLARLADSTGRVDELSLSALRSTRLRDSSDRIPTLDEVLEETARRVPIFLELKSNWDGDRRLERAVAKTLGEYSGPVATMSFDPASVREIRNLAPHLPRGLVAGGYAADRWPKIGKFRRFALRHLLEACTVLPNFLAYDVSALPATAPLFIRHAAGIPLLTWTVRSAADRQIGRRWADQIIFEGFDPDE